MKNRIYKWLDNKFPIIKTDLGPVVQLETMKDIMHVVKRVFGVDEPQFGQWVKDRCGNQFGIFTQDTKEQSWLRYTGPDGIIIQKHRDDDYPSLISEQKSLWWYQDGVLHRENGPAIIHTSGHVEYWINGKEVSKLKIGHTHTAAMFENSTIIHLAKKI